MIVKENYSLLVILSVFFLAPLQEPEVDYQKEFAGYYEDAVQLAEKIRPLLSHYAKEFDEDPQVLEAIIFPELIRYNRVYDVIETGSLCALYARFGQEYANFSIGFFQMKPGFAQSLESFLCPYNNLEWVGKLKLGGIVPVDNFNHRMDRVRRLQDLDWQIRYLIAFIKCCRIKHDLKNFQIDLEGILFLATAYNSGWNVQDTEIRKKIDLKYFHLGYRKPAKKYSYADISLHWYLQLSQIRHTSH